MPDQINKKRRNLSVIRRQSKHATKKGSRRLPEDVVLKSNEMSDMAGGICLVEKPVFDDKGTLLRKKIVGYRKMKMGKNSSVIDSHELSKKKVKKVLRALRLDKKRRGVVDDVEMSTDVTELVPVEVEPEMDILSTGNGTTIGAPPRL